MHRDIDIDLLRAFLAIEETGSFSRAADRLGRTQAAISLQIKRLEELLGQPVLARTSRKTGLTPTGETLAVYARRMIALNDEAYARICHPAETGLVRLGAPEVMTSTHLPQILLMFRRHHPRIALSVTCDLTEVLLGGFERGDFDVILFKRNGKLRQLGMPVWTEPLVWAGGRDSVIEGDTVPIILSPHPCLYRQAAVDALEKAGIKWRSVLTSHSLAGRVSAAKAGLGFTPLPREALDPDLVIADHDLGLPPLGNLDVAVMKGAQVDIGASRLTEHIIHHFEGYGRET